MTDDDGVRHRLWPVGADGEGPMATVAAALLAAAAALRDPPATKRGARAAVDAAGEAGEEAIRLGDSLRRLAIDMARRTLDAWEAAEAKPSGGKDGGKGGNG